MTLIAGMHLRGCLSLIADVLVVSPAEPAREIPLPTRAYVPPERMRGFALKPVTFYRKILELSPTATLLWAGSVNAAQEYAACARDCFQQRGSTEDALGRLLGHYPQPPTNLSAIVATTDYLGICIGDVYRSRSIFAGDYAVAGSGRRMFCETVERLSPAEVAGDVPYLADALEITGDLMAREIYTLQPLAEQFGASYEILYRGPAGFERLDDVMHMFAKVKAANGESELSFTWYAHPVRQWYEGDQLCVFSYSAHETADQGLKPGFFLIPSILNKVRPLSRPPVTLNYEPAYLSVHHVYEVNGSETMGSMILGGDAIRQNFSFVYDGTNFNVLPTEHYRERIRHRVAQLRAGNRAGSHPRRRGPFGRNLGHSDR